jgi:hypothetical protein
MRTFHCDFDKGVSCTVRVTDQQPERGKAHILDFEWSGRNPAHRMSRSLLRAYICWMNTVNKTLADQWNAKLMHVFGCFDQNPEVWVYEPGKRPMQAIKP